MNGARGDRTFGRPAERGFLTGTRLCNTAAAEISQTSAEDAFVSISAARCAIPATPALQAETSNSTRAGVQPLWISSIDTFCGAVRKAMRTPGRMVFGSIVKATPFAFSSATARSISVTVSPKWSSPI